MGECGQLDPKKMDEKDRGQIKKGSVNRVRMLYVAASNYLLDRAR